MITLDNELLTANSPSSAVVLLGGTMPQGKRWLECLANASFLAAADGGAALALKLGRCPDLLVGDFDSLSHEDVAACRKSGSAIQQLPVMKDLTDGEFLLQEMAKRGYKQLLVLGALGGRVDMQLANIYSAEALAKRGVSCLLADDNNLLLPLYAKDRQTLLLKGFAGKTLSQISLSQECQHIRLEGFLYPLDGMLRRNQTLGLSNVIQQDEARLELTAGSLLITINL